MPDNPETPDQTIARLTATIARLVDGILKDDARHQAEVDNLRTVIRMLYKSFPGWVVFWETGEIHTREGENG